MAGNGDAIIALDQKRMEATVKQDFAALASIIAEVGGPDQGTVGRNRAVRTKKLAESPESPGRGP
jgi:hypothetical protein